MDVKSVGVIGAGQMGNGIAHVLALAEYDVLLNDVSQDALDSAVATSVFPTAALSPAWRSVSALS